MAQGKWFDISPQTPVTQAARHILRTRLKLVLDWLPLALLDPDGDLEHVHQLRVSTRRAAAVLRMFHLCLPRKVARQTNKTLRSLRRAAGDARDWDVFLSAITERIKDANPDHLPALDALQGFARGNRLHAQQTLVAATPDDPKYLEQIFKTAWKSVGVNGPNKKCVFFDLGRTTLIELVDDLEQAASQNLDDYEHLHQVRILGKKLRYAMEVFASCFESAFRDEYYPAIEQMQDILGAANDSHVAEQRLTTISQNLRRSPVIDFQRLAPGLDALIEDHQQRLNAKRLEFLSWWERWHATESAFAEFLKTSKPDTVQTPS